MKIMAMKKLIYVQRNNEETYSNVNSAAGNNNVMCHRLLRNEEMCHI